jgi:predicted dinucleotide-binding enzyme
MRIGILGTGDVGRALGKGFLALGHEVKMGAREAGNEKAVRWAREVGGKASAGTFAEAAKFGEWIALATLGLANASALEQAGRDNFAGKIVLDATNPLDFGKGAPRLAAPGGVSGGEQVQQLLPGAKVVKVFNTVGNALFFKPQLPGGPPTMFLCGDDKPAKAQVVALLKDFGWESLDAGGIESAHYLEAMCLVWVLTAAPTNSWTQAFKMLRP